MYTAYDRVLAVRVFKKKILKILEFGSCHELIIKVLIHNSIIRKERC